MILRKLEDYFINCSDAKSILIFVVATFLITLVLRIIINLIFNIENTTSWIDSYESIFVFIIFAVVLAPIIETFIFQSIFYEFSTEKNRYFIIFLSSLLFASFHYFSYKSIVPLISIFLGGLVFNFAYHIYSQKNSSPYWNVVIIHASLNLLSGSTALLAQYFLNQSSH
jgi:membrane protease YdiL (CAAX protease family)